MNSLKRIVLYGCGYEAEKFLIKFPNVEISYCLDEKLHDNFFHEYYIYLPEDKKSELKSEYVLIFTDHILVYQRIAQQLKAWGLKEFEDFIPYKLFQRKMALIWGNCHVRYIKGFLSASREFSKEYAFYELKDLWNMKEADLDENLFKHCDLLVCQHIRKETSLGEMFSSGYIENLLKKDCQIVKFPNLFRLPQFLFPQTDLKNVFAPNSSVQWYRDREIDRCIQAGIYDIEEIYEKIVQKKYDADELQQGYLLFLEKLIAREKQCNIHIFDYIIEHLRDEQLFLDVEHPHKKLLGEIGNRILQYLGFARLPENLLIGNVYAHEVMTHPGVKKHFGMTWESGDIKHDNPGEKIFLGYMDEKEYIRQYLAIYGRKRERDKKSEDVAIYYRLKVQNQQGKVEWDNIVKNGQRAGSVGQAKRCCAIKIWVENSQQKFDVQYRVYLRNIGWTEYVSFGQECGSDDLEHYIQAIQMQLVGEQSHEYVLYYQVHCQALGWLKPVKEGVVAGDETSSLWLEAVKIIIQKK